MPPRDPHRPGAPAGRHAAGERRSEGGSGRLRLLPADHPARMVAKPLGIASEGPPDWIGLRVPDARHHVHVQGVTGAGKSTWLARHVLAEARAGRGVALLDCQGDLAHHVLERLPATVADRLIILDPGEQEAPPAWNVLAPTRAHHDTRNGPRDGPERGSGGAEGGFGVLGRERAAEQVVGVFRRLYAAWWGPRMDDVLRAACLTLARRPGSTLAEVVTVLTNPRWRAGLLARHGEPEGMEGFWEHFDALSDGQRAQVCGPVLSRLRSILSHRFARDLLGAPGSTFDLSAVLDGGVLIARLPKGEIGEHAAQLLGSLLLSGLWSATTARAARAPDDRPDATIVVDECHNFLHLPIGVNDALAEARGYRVSLVLAHQHLGQLPTEVREAVDANARNKLFFTVSPNDAAKLARHVAPYLDERDLSARAAFEMVARTVDHGHDTPPFTLTTAPLPPPVPGRAEFLRAAARARTGLTRAQRDLATRRRHLHDALRHDQLRPPVGPGRVGRVGHLADDHADDHAEDQAGGREAPTRVSVRGEDELPAGWIEVGRSPPSSTASRPAR